MPTSRAYPNISCLNHPLKVLSHRCCWVKVCWEDSRSRAVLPQNLAPLSPVSAVAESDCLHPAHPRNPFCCQPAYFPWWPKVNLIYTLEQSFMSQCYLIKEEDKTNRFVKICVIYYTIPSPLCTAVDCQLLASNLFRTSEKLSFGQKMTSWIAPKHSKM